MRELTSFLTIAGALAYVAIGADLLDAIGKPGTGLEWDDPPTPFRKMVVVFCWPVVWMHMRKGWR